MPPVVIPLYYQLMTAFQPQSYSPPSQPAPVEIIQTTPTPLPSPIPQLQVLGTSTQSKSIALLGDSMIDTLNADTCRASFQRYFPNLNFNLLNYGYGATNIESAAKRLTETSNYLGSDKASIISQNPDIIVIESFAYNHFGNTQGGLDRQTKALDNLIALVSSQLPKTKIVLAATIAPNSVVYSNGTSAPFNALQKIEQSNTIRAYLQNLVNFATKNKLPLANAYHPSLIGNNGFEELIESKSHIHPSVLGTEFFCDTLAKTIFDQKLIN